MHIWAVWSVYPWWLSRSLGSISSSNSVTWQQRLIYNQVNPTLQCIQHVWKLAVTCLSFTMGYIFGILFSILKRIVLPTGTRQANSVLIAYASSEFQASLRICTVSPEPLLLAHTSSESRGTFRQKAWSLAPLNGWVCTVKICHDRMLEDTNSLATAQLTNPCSFDRVVQRKILHQGYTLVYLKHLSCLIQNQQTGMCAQRRLGSASVWSVFVVRSTGS